MACCLLILCTLAFCLQILMKFYFQAFVATGFNIILNYDVSTSTNFNPAHRQSDFDREPGKVSFNYFLFLNIFSKSTSQIFPPTFVSCPNKHIEPWNIKQGNWTFSKENLKVCCPDRDGKIPFKYKKSF